MCANRKKYTMIQVAGTFIGILNKLFRSVCFNIFIFIIGFSAGYSYVATAVHYYAKKNKNYECLTHLQNNLKTQQQQIKQYYMTNDEFIRQAKLKLSHDEHKECESTIGRILINEEK